MGAPALKVSMGEGLYGLLRQESEQRSLFQRLSWSNHDGWEVLVMDGVGIMLRLQADGGMS